jgi:hypothetical protein
MHMNVRTVWRSARPIPRECFGKCWEGDDRGLRELRGWEAAARWPRLRHVTEIEQERAEVTERIGVAAGVQNERPWPWIPGASRDSHGLACWNEREPIESCLEWSRFRIAGFRGAVGDAVVRDNGP